MIGEGVALSVTGDGVVLSVTGDGVVLSVTQSLSGHEVAAARRSDAVTDGKTGSTFGRERSPIELVLVEILRVDLVEGRFWWLVGGVELASVEAALQLPALVPTLPLAT